MPLLEESPSSIVDFALRKSECRLDVPPSPLVSPDDDELPVIEAMLKVEAEDEVVGSLEVKREERRRELVQDPVFGSLVSFEFDEPILLFKFLTLDELKVRSRLENEEFDLDLLRVNFEVFSLIVLKVAFLTFCRLSGEGGRDEVLATKELSFISISSLFLKFNFPLRFETFQFELKLFLVAIKLKSLKQKITSQN